MQRISPPTLTTEVQTGATRRHFLIANISKSFTAVAVIQRIEQGKLNLDDEVLPILKIKPDVAPGARPSMTNRANPGVCTMLVAGRSGLASEAVSPNGTGVDSRARKRNCSAGAMASLPLCCSMAIAIPMANCLPGFIDPILHRAADETKAWPDGDLFERFYPSR